jgi:carboxyl-terminal processing protease
MSRNMHKDAENRNRDQLIHPVSCFHFLTGAVHHLKDNPSTEGTMRAAIWTRLAILAFVPMTSLLCDRALASDEDDATPSIVLDKESPSHLAAVTWSLFETIDQHHVLPPTRETLMTAVARAAHPSDPKHVQIAAAKLLACQSQAEFTAVFVDLWQLPDGKVRPTDGFLRELTTLMESRVFVTPAAEYVVQEQLQNNRYVGLGVTVGNLNGPHLSFNSIVPGGAADRGGLVKDEVILAVDGHDTANIPAGEVISKWLRGPKGTQVTLKLGPREGVAAREVTLTRSVVRIDSVHGRNGSSVSQGNFRDQPAVPIGYLQVGIKGSTLQELRDAEIRLRADGIRVLILDFRIGDSSNVFHHARLVADGLLDGGTMWSWQDRSEEWHVEVADRECLFRDIPLVIMVNQYSGSLHTAVAAALQDAGRAIIVGEKPEEAVVVLNSYPFARGEYYTTLPSAKLVRGRADRSWPLIPDQSTEDAAAAAVVKAAADRFAARGARPTSSTVPNLFYIRRGVESGSSSVSALFPANLQEVEILTRIGVRGLTRVSPSGNIQNREVEDETARKIAMQLLEKMYKQDQENNRSVPE